MYMYIYIHMCIYIYTHKYIHTQILWSVIILDFCIEPVKRGCNNLNRSTLLPKIAFPSCKPTVQLQFPF